MAAQKLGCHLDLVSNDELKTTLRVSKEGSSIPRLLELRCTGAKLHVVDLCLEEGLQHLRIKNFLQNASLPVSAEEATRRLAVGISNVTVALGHPLDSGDDHIQEPVFPESRAAGS